MNQGNEKETEIKQLEIAYSKISELLLPDWKKRLSEGRKLKDLVDPDKLCGVSLKELDMTSKILQKEHFSDLKNNRLDLKTKKSVLKRKEKWKEELKRHEKEVTALECEKQTLIQDREELIEEILELEQKTQIPWQGIQLSYTN